MLPHGKMTIIKTTETTITHNAYLHTHYQRVKLWILFLSFPPFVRLLAWGGHAVTPMHRAAILMQPARQAFG